MGNLTTLFVKTAGPGRHADGDGLYLLVKPGGARSWLLRVQQDGRRRDIGLGSVDLMSRRYDEETATLPLLHQKILSLAAAREKAALLRKFVKAGRDPIAERDRLRRAAPSFQEAAKACHEQLKKGWATKHGDAFISSLEEHTFRLLGQHRVDVIDTAHVVATLTPIWGEIPVMARKVRQRINTVLHFAKAQGWRSLEPPGASVSMGLERQKMGGNFAAMPYAQVPEFFVTNHVKSETTGRSALMFTILTAARSGEVRSARWKHINFENRTWDRPGELMKSRRNHILTLNRLAIEILRKRQVHGDGPDSLIFPNVKGEPISDMTMTKILRSESLPYTVHGFRSSFRDWAAENLPEIPDPVAEAALAHIIPDAVERAYKRTEFIDMRRRLLEEWCNFLSPIHHSEIDNDANRESASKV